jgi:nuclear GTP-binding protein
MILLRGVVRVENIQNPAQYISTMLDRVQRKHIERSYGIKNWKDEEDFLEIMARKSGRLLKGGEADQDSMARMVLNDFLRGKLPWYVPPPKTEGDEDPMDGRKGRLGEMRAGMKRKLDETESTVDEDGFEGFSQDEDEDEDDDDEDQDEESDEVQVEGQGGDEEEDQPEDDTSPAGK